MLTNRHTAPTAVESGAQAIITRREAVGLGRSFPLILLDAQMPQMDGFALAECIKRNPEWKTARIMMLSSAGQRGDAKRCRELGVAAYLTKPVRQGELLDVGKAHPPSLTPVPANLTAAASRCSRPGDLFRTQLQDRFDGLLTDLFHHGV